MQFTLIYDPRRENDKLIADFVQGMIREPIFKKVSILDEVGKKLFARVRQDIMPILIFEKNSSPIGYDAEVYTILSVAITARVLDQIEKEYPLLCKQ